MKKGMVLILFIFAVGIVSAMSFGEITGKVVEKIDNGIYGMSENELIAFYEENKDNLTQEQINYIITKNKDSIPPEMIDLYNNNSDSFIGLTVDEISIADIIAKNDNMSLAPLLNIFPCEMVVNFIEPEIVGFEIPEQVPLNSELFNLYIDGEFFIGLKLDNKNVSRLVCDENADSDYQILVTSKLIINTVLDHNENNEDEEINIAEFYKKNKASGDLDIRASGLMNKFKLFILNIAVKFI